MGRLDPDSDYAYDVTNQPAIECEDCGADATVNRFGSRLCESCATSADEAAYERSLSDFYGGSSPQSEGERTHAAHQAKRGQS